MHALTDLVRRIATDPIATADVWGPVVAPLLALLFLLAFRQWLGHWPDLWRARRIVLPRLGRFAEGDYAVVDELDDRVERVDVEAIDSGLGQHLSASPLIATADGRTEVFER